MLFHMLISITVIAAALKLPIENNSIVKNFYCFKNQRALSVIDARCYASNEEYLYKAHSTFSTHSVSVAKYTKELSQLINELHCANVNEFTNKLISFRSGHKSCHERTLIVGEISWFSCISCDGT